MILKNFELNKINLNNQKYFLLYGDNNGQIDETINNIFTKNYKENVYNYDENDVLNNKENFFAQVLNSSFFEVQKIIIISRVTDKLFEIFKEILEKNVDDIIFILKTNQLEKKSKLRKFYEENEKTICIAFYPDTEITLIKIATEFLNKKKVVISRESLNFIISKCNNSREVLLNELKKIELLAFNNKNISINEIMQIVYLNENHSVYELIDYCLLKNKKKTINILNENIFGSDDVVLILRTFLSKLKKILKLAKEFQINKNIDLTIKNARPPIFWKEKDTVKKQLSNWSTTNIKNLIFELNQIELKVKKYNTNSLNILVDFIINKCSEQTNN